MSNSEHNLENEVKGMTEVELQDLGAGEGTKTVTVKEKKKRKKKEIEPFDVDRKELDFKEARFVRLYVFDKVVNGDATACYMQAYGVTSEELASELASRLLEIDRISRAIVRHISQKGLNESWADLKLINLANSGETKLALEAIKEINRLKGRIVAKSQTTIVDANKLLDQMKVQSQEQRQAGSNY